MEHLSTRGVSRYQVRAFDLKTRRLVRQPVVDRSEPGERMVGYAHHRAADGDGTWIYTLYTRDREAPFIHALNTRERRAACIDLPLPEGQAPQWTPRLVMSPDGTTLRVAKGATTLVSVNTTVRATDPPVPGHG